MPLTDYQKRFLNKNLKRAMLVWSTGCYKSRTMIEWAKKHGGSTLIVVPKGILENWRRELKKWEGVADIVSKETFKLRNIHRYDNLIIDEADWFFSQGMKSALSKSLRDYLKAYNPNLIMGTATPVRSSPWNIYVAAQFLGYNWNYKEFQQAFFTPIWMGPRMIWSPKKDEATKERLRKAIANISDIIKREDEFSIPEQSFETIYIDADHGQKQRKKENLETAAIARFTADHRAEAMNRNKFDAVVRLAEENTALAVVCRYHEQMDALRAVLSEKGHVVGEVSGRKSPEERQKAIDTVNTQGGVLLIQSSCCEGWEIPNVHVMVFASMDFSCRNKIQVEGRILRMSHLNNKKVYVTLIAGKADESIKKSVDSNMDFNPLTYAEKVVN